MVEVAAPSVSDGVSADQVEAYAKAAKGLSSPEIPADNVKGLLTEAFADTLEAWGLPSFPVDELPGDFDPNAPDVVEQALTTYKNWAGDGWLNGEQLVNFSDSYDEIKKALDTAWHDKKEANNLAVKKSVSYAAFASLWNEVLDSEINNNFLNEDGTMKNDVGDELIALQVGESESGAPELQMVVNRFSPTPTIVAVVGPDVPKEEVPSFSGNVLSHKLGDFDPMAPNAVQRMVELQQEQKQWEFKPGKKHLVEFEAGMTERWTKEKDKLEAATLPQQAVLPKMSPEESFGLFATTWNELADKELASDIGLPELSVTTEGKYTFVEAEYEGITFASLNDAQGFDPMADDALEQFFDKIEGSFKGSPMDMAAFKPKFEKAWNERIAKLEAAAAPPSVPEQLEEIMPTKIPKVPKKYPEGVGENTKVVIEIGSAKYINDPNTSWGDVYVVKRVSPDGSEQLIGAAGGIGKARSMARKMSAEHEQIDEVRYAMSEHESILGDKLHKDYMDKLKAGDFFVYNGDILKVKKVEKGQKEGGGLTSSTVSLEYEFVNGDTSSLNGWSIKRVAVIPPVTSKDQDYLKQLWDQAKASGEEAQAEVTPEWVRGKMMEAGYLEASETMIRTARPVKWIPELQHGWDLEELSGSDWQSEAHPRLRALGWREIKPRQKDFIRYINKNGQRLTVYRDKDGKITKIDHQKLVFDAIDTQSAKDFHATLGEALKTGGPIDHLDPKNSDVPALRTPHVQQLIFDTAVGQQNDAAAKAGLGGDKVKVKSDAEYIQEIDDAEASPSIETIIEEQELDSATRVQALGSVVSAWDLEDADVWDFQSRMFAIDPNTDDEVGAAITAILRSPSLTRIAQGDDTTPPDVEEKVVIDPDLVTKKKGEEGLYEAAEKLAKVKNALLAWDPDKPEENPTKLNPASAAFYQAILEKSEVAWDTSSTAAEESVYNTASNMRDQLFKDEIAARRKAEGTVESMGDQFDIPTWDTLEFEPQTMAEIESIVAEQKPVGVFEAEMDVPGFYTGGLVKDAVLLHRKDKTWGKVTLDNDEDMSLKMLELGAEVGPNLEPIKPGQAGSYPLYDGTSLTVYEDSGAGGGIKRIEYVPHDSTYSGQAPTSQRGRLTLTGYTPAEAAMRLRELGVIGDLEPEVPFQSVMRSRRRVGMPVPIHDEYVRGEAEFPKTDGRLVHGLTGGGADAFISILDTGSLLSIEQRYHAGILQKIKTASPSGDIRSGIDHAVFVGYGAHSACGSSSSYKFVLKPSAFLARDVVFAPSDFGSADSRYNSYKNYKNKLQSSVDEDKSNLYEPNSAAVRQAHIDYIAKGTSAEYNVGPAVALEDVEFITVPPGDVSAVRKKLQDMLSAGKLASIPTVLAAGSSEANEAINKPLNKQ